MMSQDIQIAKERMAKAGRVPEGKPYTVKTILGYLTSWKTLLFTLIFGRFPPIHSSHIISLMTIAMQPFCSQPTTSFVFWLKAHNKKGKPLVYTVAQIVNTHPQKSPRSHTNRQQNEYPTLSNAFTAVYSLLAVWISDGPLRGRRWPTIIFGNLVAIVIFTLLVVTPVFGPFSHRAPLYILSSISGTAVPLTMAWMSELISDNAEQRAFTAASMNTLQCKRPHCQVCPSMLMCVEDTFNAWIPLVWFQQIHQPNGTSLFGHRTSPSTNK